MSTEPTNEAIRLACAEEMGWKCHQSAGAWGDAPNYTWTTPNGDISFSEDAGDFSQLPNYPECDKAARELRMALTEEEQEDFVDELRRQSGASFHTTNREVFAFINASPRDQAIAFLKVRGNCRDQLPEEALSKVNSILARP